MSSECPNGHGRQNVVSNITADGSIPRQPHDVIAQKLACGCVVGGEEYSKFQELVRKIQNEEAEDISRSRKDATNKKAAAYKSYVLKGADSHAE